MDDISDRLDEIDDFMMKELDGLKWGLAPERLVPQARASDKRLSRVRPPLCILDALFDSNRRALGRLRKVMDSVRRQVLSPPINMPVPLEQRARQAPRILQEQIMGSDVPAVPGYDIAARLEPLDFLGANPCGGDVYAFAVDEERKRLSFVVGDAMGHGWPAALFAARVVGMFQVAAPTAITPSRMVSEINRRLITAKCENVRFATLFVGELDLCDHQMLYVAAGHGPVLQRHPTDSQCRQLEVSGPPVGIDAHASFTDTLIDIDVGDRLLIPSDGILDRKRLPGESFGPGRLCDSFARALRSDTSAAWHICEQVFVDLNAFCSDRVDDESIVVLMRQDDSALEGDINTCLDKDHS